MKPEDFTESFVQNLLLALPYWHSKIVRPFKETLNGEMSLETYYCLELLRSKGPCTMTELAQALKAPKQQITKLVDRLWQCHFVERIYEEKDRRLIRIMLTEEADTYIRQYNIKNTYFTQKLKKQLSEEELTELCKAMETLAKVLPRLS